MGYAQQTFPVTMASQGQQDLARLWKQAPRGRLSPWSEALAWGLREGWRHAHGKKIWGMLPWIAERLVLVGGGKPAEEVVRCILAMPTARTCWPSQTPRT